MYLIELPFFLYGLYRIARIGGNLRTVVFGWILLAPIPAAPTNELPHAGRTVTVLPMLQIVTAVGLVGLVQLWRDRTDGKPVVRYAVLSFAAILAVINMAYYAVMYIGRYNAESGQDFQYGFAQAAAYTEAHNGKYKKIVVSSRLEQSHIFFLFFTRYDPATYLKEGGTMWNQKTDVQDRFGKYEFRPIDWKNESADGTVLYVGRPSEMPPGNLLRISYPDGSPAMEISDVKCPVGKWVEDIPKYAGAQPTGRCVLPDK
jgi:hypothetical protein